MVRFVLFVPLSLSLLALEGCKDDVQCEKARMSLNKTWTELRDAAARRKLEGVDIPTWADVERKTELLESSFVTPQVTWESASKAKQAIAADLPRLQANHDALAVTFLTSAEDALKQQSDFEKQCR